MGEGKKRASGKKTGTPSERRLIPAALKWVGGITAVLSLIFGLQQLTEMISGLHQRDRQTKELLKTSQMEEEAHDYAAAWDSIAEADRLTKGRREVRAAQETLAMDWLENARLGLDQQRFGDIVEKVAPVLNRAASTAQGARKADLLAHLGWAEFLRSRDGISADTPDHYYQQALKIDAQNVYAHAMLGHWILWHNGRVADAREQFSLALAAGSNRDYVRAMQLSGYENVHNEEADMELVRVVSDMLSKGERVDPRTRSALWAIYSFHFGAEETKRQQLLAAVPPVHQLATFSSLFDVPDFDQSKLVSRELYRAILQEAAGQRTQALQTLLSLRSKLTHDYDPSIRNEIEKSIRRLSGTRASLPESCETRNVSRFALQPLARSEALPSRRRVNPRTSRNKLRVRDLLLATPS